MNENKGILIPSIWMIIISLLLFWLPGFGPLIAGYVGGKKAGSAGRAFMAALLPMLIAGFLVFLAVAFIGFPFIGVLAGATLVIYIAVLEIALIAGALIGGLLAEK